MIPSKELMIISNGAIVRHLKNNEDEFLSELAKELMLDELLCGEANPKDFLIECMGKVVDSARIKHHESMADSIRRKQTNKE